jgi:hypothetical protein
MRKPAVQNAATIPKISVSVRVADAREEGLALVTRLTPGKRLDLVGMVTSVIRYAHRRVCSPHHDGAALRKNFRTRGIALQL